LLAHGRWFSPASSTTKTGRHDIAEILLKVALNTINKISFMVADEFYWRKPEYPDKTNLSQVTDKLSYRVHLA
jgi:hypothetical protein